MVKLYMGTIVKNSKEDKWKKFESKRKEDPSLSGNESKNLGQASKMTSPSTAGMMSRKSVFSERPMHIKSSQGFFAS